MSSDTNRNRFAFASVQDVMTHKHEFLKRKMVSVKGEAPLAKAFQKLKRHRIHSVPVYSGKKFIGFLDVIDLTIFANEITGNFTGGTASVKGFLEADREWCGTTCESFLNDKQKRSDKQASSNFISPQASLATAAAFLSSKGTHRLAVINEAQTVLGVISQSDILRYIDRHLDRNDSLFIKPIKDLPLGSSQVITIGQNSSVSDAFVLIQKHHVTGIPAVDDDGKLVGCISSSDIKGEKEFDIDSLIDLCGHTIAYFLSSTHRKSLVTATLEEDAESIIEKFRQHKVHRVFVVDNDHKPIRVISITDILALFVPKPEELQQQDHPAASENSVAPSPPTPDSACTVLLQKAFDIEPEPKN